MKSQYRVCLCFFAAMGMVVGCSDAPKSTPTPVTKTDSTGDAGSKEAGGASTDTAKHEETAPANTGGPLLIPPGEVDAELWPAVDPSVPTHTLTKEVEYYKTGPQQGSPPDGKFAAGRKVAILENAGSYAKVRAEDGTEAFVAVDALKSLDGVPKK